MKFVDEKGAWQKKSLYQAMSETAASHPERTFICTERGSVAYADAVSVVATLAMRLSRRFGVRRSDHVVLCSANSIESALALVAVYSIGACPILLPSTLGTSTAEIVRADFKPCLALHDSVASSCAKTSFSGICPLLDLHDFIEAALSGEDGQNDVAEFDETVLCDDAPMVLYSSGSTGRPKAMLSTCSTFLANMANFCSSYGLSENDVLYAPIPFDHCFGLGGLFSAILCGVPLVTCGKYRPEKSLRLIAEHKPTIYLCVPTMIVREGAAFTEDKYSLSSLRVCVVGGAPCSAEAMARYEQLSGCRLVQSYGMTEMSGGITVGGLSDSQEYRRTTVGRPFPNVEISLDSETHEILCRSTCMASGWMGDEGFVELPVDENGWFRSGDVGRFDSEGRLVVVGRIKNIIVRGGINIFPGEIEDFYNAVAGVTECHVVGYPDETLGERTCLCYTAAPDFDMSHDAMRKLSLGSLEKCKLPDYVIRMEKFPRLANGKTDIKTLESIAKQCVDGAVHRLPSEGDLYDAERSSKARN